MKNIPIRRITPTDTETHFAQSFRIRSLDDLLAGQDMVQDLHRHDFFFILSLAKAKGLHEIDFIPYNVDDRSIFILRPGQVHKLTLLAGSEGYLLEVSKSFYHPGDSGTSHLLRKAANTNFCKTEDNAFQKLHAILGAMLEEYRDRKEGYQHIITANLNIFFIEFIRQRQHSEASATTGNRYEHERLDEFMELLETHAANHKQVSDYADMLNLSVYQLNTITRNTLGKTPSELINEYIILESKRHLLATADQVNQIAYRLGYDDPSYFIRFFKKHTGYSPDLFRSNLR